MTDQAKRKTLKTMSLAGVVASTGVAGSWVLSDGSGDKSASDELARLTLEVSHQWRGEDLKVVIKNDTDNTVTMTQLTPSKISTPMGDIDFDQVIAKGPVTLPPHGEIQIYAAREGELTTPVSASGQFLRSVQRAIANNVTVVTDNNAFAVIKPVFYPQIA